MAEVGNTAGELAGGIDARIQELKQIAGRLEALEAQRVTRDRESWTRLARIYETMKPRDAVAVWKDLSPDVLTHLLPYMKPEKVTHILAALETYQNDPKAMAVKTLVSDYIADHAKKCGQERVSLANMPAPGTSPAGSPPVPSGCPVKQ